VKTYGNGTGVINEIYLGETLAILLKYGSLKSYYSKHELHRDLVII
tara:strand:- start:272 stop:409 length:138 start_codon:yes stop_codon:yes gene_type:complete